MRSIFRKAAVTTFGAAALTAALAFTAAADPAFVPDANDIVGVGSDTTQFALNDLAAAYNGGQDSKVASFDATGASPIEIRSGVSIARPNGSSAGITALKNNAGLDFARSSRTRQGSDGDSVLFLEFAKDELRYAVDAPATNAPLDLTKTELKRIFTCDVTTWSQLRAGASSATIAPKLPQAGSGTRTTFLTSLDNITPGSCVNDNVQEHDPAAVDGNANAIAAFSVGRFNTLPAGQIQLNTGGYSYQRSLFNVVRDTNGGGPINGGVDSRLQGFFGDGSGDNGGWICSAAAKPVIEAAGFQQISADDLCGAAS